MTQGTAPPLTWRELDDDVLRKLHTDHANGCWQVSDRVSTEGGRIIIDGTSEEPWPDEYVSYAETALNVARWHREAVLVMNYPDAAQLALAVREIDFCEQHRAAVKV